MTALNHELFSVCKLVAMILSRNELGDVVFRTVSYVHWQSGSETYYKQHARSQR